DLLDELAGEPGPGFLLVRVEVAELLDVERVADTGDELAIWRQQKELAIGGREEARRDDVRDARVRRDDQVARVGRTSLAALGQLEAERLGRPALERSEREAALEEQSAVVFESLGRADPSVGWVPGGHGTSLLRVLRGRARTI